MSKELQNRGISGPKMGHVNVSAQKLLKIEKNLDKEIPSKKELKLWELALRASHKNSTLIGFRF